MKAIGAVYKIPLTSYIGTVGRGYYAFAYNLVLPLHAVTMGAFPIALSKLVSEYRTRNDCRTVLALKKGALRLFFFVGLFGMLLLLLCAKPYCELLVNRQRVFMPLSPLHRHFSFLVSAEHIVDITKAR